MLCFLLLTRRPPRSTLCPYSTLFRSSAIVAAQRQKVISDTHVGDGSVVGAMESAIEQVKPMAIGMNVGGKIGIARWNEHLCVAIFVGVGVLHFNEVTVGMAHRVLRNDLPD